MRTVIRTRLGGKAHTLFLLVGLLALAACGTALPPNPKAYRQALVEAAVSYTAAAHAATVYVE